MDEREARKRIDALERALSDMIVWAEEYTRNTTKCVLAPAMKS